MQKSWYLTKRQQMTFQEMILAGVGVSNAVRGVLPIGGTGELLLVGTTYCYEYTKTDNIKHFEYCVLSDCTL